jgi:hypothetical protein
MFGYKGPKRKIVYLRKMNLFRTTSSFVLAFLVLVSSSSFMVGIHFCNGDIKHMALFTKADGCEKERELPPCHRHLAAPCCEDETVIHEAEGFKSSISEVLVCPALFSDLDLPNVIVAEIIPAVPIIQGSYYNYDPPLRSVDLTVTHSVFQI